MWKFQIKRIWNCQNDRFWRFQIIILISRKILHGETLFFLHHHCNLTKISSYSTDFPLIFVISYLSFNLIQNSVEILLNSRNFCKLFREYFHGDFWRLGWPWIRSFPRFGIDFWHRARILKSELHFSTLLQDLLERSQCLSSQWIERTLRKLFWCGILDLFATEVGF